MAHTVQVYNSVCSCTVSVPCRCTTVRTAVCPIGATSVHLGPERYVKGVQQCGVSVERPRTVRSRHIPKRCCYRRLCRPSVFSCIDGFFSFKGSVGLEEAVDEPCVEQRQPPRLAHHSVPVWPPFQARGVAFHRDLSPTGRHCFRIPAPRWPVFGLSWRRVDPSGSGTRTACADCSAVTCGRHVACRAYMLLLPRNYPKSASGRLP